MSERVERQNDRSVAEEAGSPPPQLAARLQRGPLHVVVLSGAGLSAASGLATFRDADGHWAR
ncbi:MAG TPA: hypothetical protein P5144_12365, partial [Thermoanaerobaculia bacterium]|nr:hypothetical protein [Thermoanaerobaculia bacterium]